MSERGPEAHGRKRAAAGAAAHGRMRTTTAAATAAALENEPARTRRVLVIRNPNAGSKAGVATNSASDEDIRRALDAAPVDAEVFESDSEDSAMERVRAARDERFDAIVAAGGDGTVHAIARELLDTDVPLGILPLGSAMNTARSLWIPRELEAAARVLAEAPVRSVDAGEANGTIFFEGTSVGLSAAVFGEAQQVDEGRWSAVLSMLSSGLRYPPHRMWLDLDGRRTLVRALTLAVMNGPYTGLGLTLAPDARVDDGLLDVVVFEGISRWALGWHMLRVLGGRERPLPGIRRARARHVTVTARSRLEVRCDATDLGWTPVEIVVRPATLRVIAPSAPPPDDA